MTAREQASPVKAGALVLPLNRAEYEREAAMLVSRLNAEQERANNLEAERDALKVALERVAKSEPRPLKSGAYPADVVQSLQRTAREALRACGGGK